MHVDPKAKKEIRIRVNLNHYQADAVEALARLHRKQTATYVAEIVEAHLDMFAKVNDKNMLNECA